MFTASGDQVEAERNQCDIQFQQARYCTVFFYFECVLVDEMLCSAPYHHHLRWLPTLITL